MNHIPLNKTNKIRKEKKNIKDENITKRLIARRQKTIRKTFDLHNFVVLNFFFFIHHQL